MFWEHHGVPILLGWNLPCWGIWGLATTRFYMGTLVFFQDAFSIQGLQRYSRQFCLAETSYFAVSGICQCRIKRDKLRASSSGWHKGFAALPKDKSKKFYQWYSSVAFLGEAYINSMEAPNISRPAGVCYEDSGSSEDLAKGSESQHFELAIIEYYIYCTYQICSPFFLLHTTHNFNNSHILLCINMITPQNMFKFIHGFKWHFKDPARLSNIGKLRQDTTRCVSAGEPLRTPRATPPRPQSATAAATGEMQGMGGSYCCWTKSCTS